MRIRALSHFATTGSVSYRFFGHAVGAPMRSLIAVRVNVNVQVLSALLFVVATLTPACAADSWVGKMMIPKKANIRIAQMNQKGEEEDEIATLTLASYEVIAEKGTRIKVRHKGVEGWLDKKEVVLASEAVDYFTDRIRENGSDAALYHRRAEAWRLKGDLDNSIKDLTSTIRLEPNSPIAFFNRARAWADQKKFDKAVRDFEEVIRLDRDSFAAYNNCAWLLATCPDEKVRDGKRAVKFATQACEFSDWRVATCLDTLATAYAEVGDFANAIKWVEKALEDTDYAKEAGDVSRRRLQMYKDKKPYREE